MQLLHPPETRRGGSAFHLVSGGRQDDVEAGPGPGAVPEVAPVGGRSAGVLLDEVLDEGLLDAEYGVVLQQFVAADEDVGDQCPQAGSVTMKCRWEARMGERPTASSIFPTGPSWGIG